MSAATSPEPAPADGTGDQAAVDEPAPAAEPSSPSPPTPPAAAAGPLLTLADVGVAGWFYDAAVWPDIPHGGDAALYADGEYAARPDAPLQLQLRRHRWITVTGDWRTSSIVDWEKSNPVFRPSGLRGFVRGRRSRSQDAIVYVNQETAAEAIAALHDFGHGRLLAYPRLFWWVATLDDVQRTAAELVAQLARDWDAPEITVHNLWANQYGQIDGGTVDVSNRYLPWQP